MVRTTRADGGGGSSSGNGSPLSHTGNSHEGSEPLIKRAPVMTAKIGGGGGYHQPQEASARLDAGHRRVAAPREHQAASMISSKSRRLLRNDGDAYQHATKQCLQQPHRLVSNLISRSSMKHTLSAINLHTVASCMRGM